MSIKVKGLDGREYSWNLVSYLNNNRNPSSLHLEARELLHTKYPFDQILEEVNLPGSNLIADFYIHSKKMIVEVHGQQHYKYNAHFFKTRGDFLQAQKRDKEKVRWAELNGITLVALPYNERENWERIIDERH
jgi:hypothetical protein